MTVPRFRQPSSVIRHKHKTRSSPCSGGERVTWACLRACIRRVGGGGGSCLPASAAAGTRETESRGSFDSERRPAFLRNPLGFAGLNTTSNTSAASQQPLNYIVIICLDSPTVNTTELRGATTGSRRWI